MRPEVRDHAFGARDQALECMIMRSYTSHAVFSGPVHALLGVLFRVLEPSRRVFDIHFAKIDFYFFTKLNPVLTR